MPTPEPLRFPFVKSTLCGARTTSSPLLYVASSVVTWSPSSFSRTTWPLASMCDWSLPMTPSSALMLNLRPDRSVVSLNFENFSVPSW